MFMRKKRLEIDTHFGGTKKLNKTFFTRHMASMSESQFTLSNIKHHSILLSIQVFLSIEV